MKKNILKIFVGLMMTLAVIFIGFSDAQSEGDEADQVVATFHLSFVGTIEQIKFIGNYLAQVTGGRVKIYVTFEGDPNLYEFQPGVSSSEGPPEPEEPEKMHIGL